MILTADLTEDGFEMELLNTSATSAASVSVDLLQSMFYTAKRSTAAQAVLELYEFITDDTQPFSAHATPIAVTSPFVLVLQKSPLWA
jgi:hypothetical protein